MNKRHCDCQACRALDERYKGDPELLSFYRKKLLISGWAGDADRVERAYKQAHAPFAQAGARSLVEARRQRDERSTTA